MKTFHTIAALAGWLVLSNAQITINSNGTITCPAIPANGAYCAGNSLSTNIIVRCSGTAGQSGNCNDNLAGVPPVGVKTSAECWQSSSTAGDAACSFNGLVYGSNGTFPIPSGNGGGSSSSATVSASTSPAAPYGNSTTSVKPSQATTTSVVVCGGCTTTLPGGQTVTGGSGPSTYTAVYTPTATAGAGSGGQGTSSSSSPSATLASGNDASGINTANSGYMAGAFAALVGVLGLL